VGTTINQPGSPRSSGSITALGGTSWPLVADQAVAIEREVSRRVGPRIEPELVKAAVENALENRRPRW
jgi:hypothetical protein